MKQPKGCYIEFYSKESKDSILTKSIYLKTEAEKLNRKYSDYAIMPCRRHGEKLSEP